VAAVIVAERKGVVEDEDEVEEDEEGGRMEEVLECLRTMPRTWRDLRISAKQRWRKSSSWARNEARAARN